MSPNIIDDLPAAVDRLIPDAEKIVSRYLRVHPDVSTLGARIVGKSPDRRDTPWVRITQLDASNEPRSRVEHLISFLLQFDCYAGRDGGQPEASMLARTVRAALHAMPDARHEEAVVTQVTFTSMIRNPDLDIEPARERVILGAIVRIHAVSA